SAGVPKPPYWPMIQTPGSGLIPRVYGNSPGRSVPAEGGPGRSSVTRRLRVSFPDFDDDRLALADAAADRGQPVVRAPVALPSRASRADSAGIDAIRSGCPDAIAQLISVASGSLRRRSASSGAIRTIADAPVFSPGAFPAVTVGLP